MSVKSENVAEILNLAKTHDDLAASKGWRADQETDRALGQYQGARAFATKEELDLVDRIL